MSLEKKIANGDFIEYEEVYKDNFYGTLKSEVERIREEGKNVVFDVDVVGGVNIKNIFEKFLFYKKIIFCKKDKNLICGLRFLKNQKMKNFVKNGEKLQKVKQVLIVF